MLEIYFQNIQKYKKSQDGNRFLMTSLKNCIKKYAYVILSAFRCCSNLLQVRNTPFVLRKTQKKYLRFKSAEVQLNEVCMLD